MVLAYAHYFHFLLFYGIFFVVVARGWKKKEVGRISVLFCFVVIWKKMLDFIHAKCVFYP